MDFQKNLNTCTVVKSELAENRKCLINIDMGLL